MVTIEVIVSCLHFIWESYYWHIHFVRHCLTVLACWQGHFVQVLLVWCIYIAMNILNIGLWLICAITVISMCLGWLISYCAIVAKTLSKALGHAAQGSWLGALPKPPKPQTLHTIQKRKSEQTNRKKKNNRKTKRNQFIFVCFSWNLKEKFINLYVFFMNYSICIKNIFLKDFLIVKRIDFFQAISFVLGNHLIILYIDYIKLVIILYLDKMANRWMLFLHIFILSFY